MRAAIRYPILLNGDAVAWISWELPAARHLRLGSRSKYHAHRRTAEGVRLVVSECGRRLGEHALLEPLGKFKPERRCKRCELAVRCAR